MIASIPTTAEDSCALALGDKHRNNISYIVFESSSPEYPPGHRGYIEGAAFSENGIYEKDNLLIYSKEGLLANKAAPRLVRMVVRAHAMSMPCFHMSRASLLPVQSDQAIDAMAYGFNHDKPLLIASGAISFMLPCSGMERTLLHLNDPFDLVANMTQVPLKALLEQEGLTEESDPLEIDSTFVCSAIWVMAMSNGRTLDEDEESTNHHSCYRAAETIERRMAAHGIHGTAEMDYALAMDLQTAFGDWYDTNPDAGILLSIRAVHGRMMMTNRFAYLDPFFCESFLESLWRQRRIDETSASNALWSPSKRRLPLGP